MFDNSASVYLLQIGLIHTKTFGKADNNGNYVFLVLPIVFGILTIGIITSVFAQTANMANTTMSNPGVPIYMITVTTDKSSYQYGDIITITDKISVLTGNNAIPLAELDNKVRNPQNVLVSDTGLFPSRNGTFAFQVLATGPLWTQNGIYTVVGKYGTSTQTTTFSLNGASGAPIPQVTSPPTTPGENAASPTEQNYENYLRHLNLNLTQSVTQTQVPTPPSLYDLQAGDWITYQTSVAFNDNPPSSQLYTIHNETDLNIHNIQTPGLFQIPTNSKIGDQILIRGGYLSCNCPVTGITNITVGNSDIQSFEVKSDYGEGQDNNGGIYTGTIDNFYDIKTGLMLQSSQEFTMFGVHEIMKIIVTNAQVNGSTITEAKQIVQNTTPSVTQSKIPVWVKNIFIWYGQGSISDDELIGAIQFLVQQGIIHLK